MSRSQPTTQGSGPPHTHPSPTRRREPRPLTADHRPRLLRLSVTDRCDLRCRYCLPAGRVSFIPRDELPSLDDLLAVVAWLVENAGVDRVKLTGGEPLLRRGLDRLVGGCTALPGVREVSLTTNGTRLARHVAALKAAGLGRVNVSLDTLDPARFAALTRGGDVRRVLAGIAAARSAGLARVKLNAVLRRSSWREDVPGLLDFAAAQELEVRFIELMRTGTEAAWAQAEFVAADEVRATLERDGRLRRLPSPASSPARRTLARWKGRDVALGWITPVSHSFCGTCDRLRLDARGRLRRCLMDPVTLPLAELLRCGGSAAALDHAERYLLGKRAPVAMDAPLPMRAIGG